MDALFHTKSRTCITQFVKASRIKSTGPKDIVLCEPQRFARGRAAADTYLAHVDRKKNDATHTQRKIEGLLTRIAGHSRSAQAVAEVSLAHAMAPALLEKVAHTHFAAAHADIQKRAYHQAEQELQVIEALFASCHNAGHASSQQTSAAVAAMRTQALQNRCEDLLGDAQAACKVGRYIEARSLADKVVGKLDNPAVDAAARQLLEPLRRRAVDLVTTAQFGEDHVALEQAWLLINAHEAALARDQLVLLERTIVRTRPTSHPSHAELGAVRGAMALCAHALSVDEKHRALTEAQARGDLTTAFAHMCDLSTTLKRLPDDLPCQMDAATQTGLRHFRAHTSKLPVYAAMLAQVSRQPPANRDTVLANLYAMAALEGPAGSFVVYSGTEAQPVPQDVASYRYPSMKARVAAQAPLPHANTRVTLRMGSNAMTLHSANYTRGLADIIEHASGYFADSFAQAQNDAKPTALLFDALAFTCVEAQISALQQAHIDPMEEDLSDKNTPHKRCDEYLRVFHLKQIRRYATDHALNPVSHADFIDESPNFIGSYFNVKTFTQYLRDKGFVDTISEQTLQELLVYQLDVVCVLSQGPIK